VEKSPLWISYWLHICSQTLHFSDGTAPGYPVNAVGALPAKTDCSRDLLSKLRKLLVRRGNLVFAGSCREA
jgi:hypothetical protein